MDKQTIRHTDKEKNRKCGESTEGEKLLFIKNGTIVRNMVMREVRAVKYAYKKRVAQAVARNYKHFWAYVQSRTTTNETITRMKMVNRDIIEDDKIIAQEMNQVLNGVYVREDTGQPTLDLDSVFQGSKLQEILINRECIR